MHRGISAVYSEHGAPGRKFLAGRFLLFLVTFILLVVMNPFPTWAAAPLGHFIIAERTIENIESSGSAPPGLLDALKDPDCRKAFCGGAIAPDICEAESHYGNTSALANNMVQAAYTDLANAMDTGDLNALKNAQKNLAFSYGWLSHCAADLDVHPRINASVGDTFRYCDMGQKLKHGVLETQFDSYIWKNYRQPGEKYTVSIPYTFLSGFVGKSEADLRSGMLKLNFKTVGESALKEQTDLSDKLLESRWGDLFRNSCDDSLKFIRDPSELGNWDLDCGRISTAEFEDLRDMVISINGGKLPKGWGKSYLSWYEKVKDLPSDKKRTVLARLIKGNEAEETTIKTFDDKPGQKTGGAWNFSGTWQTDDGTIGKMILSQSGMTVTGTYTHADGKVEGTASEGEFVGKWTQSSAGAEPYGEFEMTLSSDGKSLTGRWKYDSRGAWYGFSAKKI